MLSAMESSVYGTQERGVKPRSGVIHCGKNSVHPWGSVWELWQVKTGERKAQTCDIAWFQQICEVNYFQDK